MRRSATGGIFFFLAFPSAILLHHLVPPRDVIGLVASHAHTDAPNLIVGQRRLTAKPIGGLEGAEDLLLAHPPTPHGPGQAGQGAVPVAVHDLPADLPEAAPVALASFGWFFAEGALEVLRQAR